MVAASVAIAGSACRLNADLREAGAYNRYAEIDHLLSRSIRVGATKAEVLEVLQSQGISYEDRGDAARLDPTVREELLDMFPEITVHVSSWTGYVFPASLYVGFYFRRSGELKQWSPLRQEGP